MEILSKECKEQLGLYFATISKEECKDNCNDDICDGCECKDCGFEDFRACPAIAIQNIDRAIRKISRKDKL